MSKTEEDIALEAKAKELKKRAEEVKKLLEKKEKT